MDSDTTGLRPPMSRAAGAGAILLVAGASAATPPAATARPAPTDGTPAAPRPTSAAQEADTVAVPRAGRAPSLDCQVAEWSAEGRVSLSRGEPRVVAGRGTGDATDLTARVHLSWSRDTLYVMADVRDDRVRPGSDGEGDRVRVEAGGAAVWIPAPGGDADAARTGPRGAGGEVPSAICATEYGWLAEVAVPAERMGGALRLGDLLGLQVWAHDPDDDAGEGAPPYLRWSGVAALSAAPPEEGADADSVLARLREDVTLEELRSRSGARDTTVELPGGRTVPGVRVDVAGVPAVAFAEPGSGDVTYWLRGGQGSAVEDLGFYRTVAALHRQLGQLRAAEDREPRAVYPEVRFELLPGVIFRLGDPGAETGAEGEVSRSALPTDVFVRAGSGG